MGDVEAEMAVGLGAVDAPQSHAAAVAARAAGAVDEL